MGLPQDIIQTALKKNIRTRDELLEVSRRVTAAVHGQMPDIAVLRSAYLSHIEENPEDARADVDRMLRRCDVRSLSGVAIVTVLTKPFPCPGKCVYCPTEAIMPKSYLSNEPAAMRALMNRFDPYKQVASRLRALTMNGHPVDKVELIVKGGTWSSYPWKYQQWFIKRCFDACTHFEARERIRTHTLLAAQNINEHAGSRIIGLTLETRPDHITPKEIVRLRTLGCTRIELGVQSISDEILESTKRGHTVEAVVLASRLLRDAGYKTDFHMMPQLPGSTAETDGAELREIFNNPDFRPDMLKIYPCVVVELAELYHLWKEGAYTPYPDQELIDMLVSVKQDIPRYCRISRLIRDIPSTSIVAGNMVTNLRQEIQKKMKKANLKCVCLRCREIGRVLKEDASLADAAPVSFDDIYMASEGEEHFLSIEDKDRKAIFAFCRLRLPSAEDTEEVTKMKALIPEIEGVAFIRELHTYGHLVPINTQNPNASQHKGHGKRLMTQAEDIARKAGYKKMAVISGIGVREYYRKIGYHLEGSYMMKEL